MRRSILWAALLALAVAVTITACGGGGGSQAADGAGSLDWDAGNWDQSSWK
jgi:hypothetical protein